MTTAINEQRTARIPDVRSFEAMNNDIRKSRSQFDHECEKCGGPTALLAQLSRLGDKPAYRIFECSRCTVLTWIPEKIGE